jgi:hypothetical protein
MRVWRVREDERVAAVLVAEEVVDALALEQPRHELQVGLAVLHDVLAPLVRLGEGVLEVVKAAVLEDARDDLGDAEVLPDAPVGGEPELPEPRPQREAVERLTVVVGLEVLEARHAAAPVANLLRVVVLLEVHRRRLAEQLLRGDVGPHADDVELVGERLRERLDAAHRVEHDVVAERRRKRDRSRLARVHRCPDFPRCP